MTDYVHVRDLDTGHQYPIPVDRYDPAAHKKTGKPATRRASPTPATSATANLPSLLALLPGRFCRDAPAPNAASPFAQPR